MLGDKNVCRIYLWLLMIQIMSRVVFHEVNMVADKRRHAILPCSGKGVWLKDELYICKTVREETSVLTPCTRAVTQTSSICFRTSGHFKQSVNEHLKHTFSLICAQYGSIKNRLLGRQENVVLTHV